jgi:ubiquinone/menaquinone biosynthesis C-methylase UbiE
MTSRDPAFFEGTEMPTAGWWEALWPNPAGVLEAVGLKRDMDAIDLCCGNGWFTLEMAKVARRVMAVDIDHTMLEAARDHLGKFGATNCEFVEGDAYKLAVLGCRPVDFVFMANAFHGVPDQPRLAQSVCKTLRLGGRFAVVNWHRRPREETAILGEPRDQRLT